MEYLFALLFVIYVVWYSINADKKREENRRAENAYYNSPEQVMKRRVKARVDAMDVHQAAEFTYMHEIRANKLYSQGKAPKEEDTEMYHQALKRQGMI